METALYLIPVMLSDEPLDKVLPAYNLQIVKEIKYFIVENVRSARRFLKSATVQSTSTRLRSTPSTSIHAPKKLATI